jgi:N6-L-threonylcarbamoyladenine synthase
MQKSSFPISHQNVKKPARTILAIETSCDETAAAVVVNGCEVRSNVISSQIDIHSIYGGVVPEIASRKHIENIIPVIQSALDEAKVTLQEIDAIAVTSGPGLVGALLIGVSAAKAIAYAQGLPLIGVHHIEGHICANALAPRRPKPPYMCLVVSGGHTHLVAVREDQTYEVVGRTRDDACGEAFDKVARALGLGYPGGPKIDRTSKEGDPRAFSFPRAKIEDAPYDFSFSGLKSAVINTLNQWKMKHPQTPPPIADLAASFQEAAIESLTVRAIDATKEYGFSSLALAGGVAANTALRASLAKRCGEEKLEFFVPPPIFCTDNAAMIGAAADGIYQRGEFAGYDLNAVPNLALGER